MTEYRTVQGDTVDILAWRHYGSEQYAAAIYEANPGLADLGPILPIGTIVSLPSTGDVIPAEEPTVHIWD